MTSTLARAGLVLVAVALGACTDTSTASGTDDTGAGDDAVGETDSAVADDTSTADDASEDEGGEIDAGNVVADAAAPPDAPAVSVPGDFTGAGPLAVGELHATLAMPASTGCSGALCNTTLDVNYPTAGATDRHGPYPVAVFSNGFNLPSSQYTSYATRLASWGYVVIRYDVPSETILNSVPHDTLANYVVQMIDWADARDGDTGSPLHGLAEAAHTVVVGHSRGGKVSVLAGTRNARIVAAVGLDPVDAPPPGMSASASFPSAVAALAASARPLPLVALQSDLGGTGAQACAPSGDNASHFYAAATGPAFFAVLSSTGHMQFLDNRPSCGLTCVFCANGTTGDATVRAFSQTMMVAWAEHYTRGAEIDRYIQGSYVAAQLTAHVITSASHR